MENYVLDRYRIVFDKEATSDWYQKYKGWDCSCADCQNFLTMVRKGKLPGAVTQMLQTFGLPADKPTYICKLYSSGESQLYQFNYRVAGKILNGPAPCEAVNFFRGSAMFGYDPYPWRAPGFPAPCFDLMLYVYLPLS